MSNILVTGANGQLGNEIRVLTGTCNNYLYTDVAELDITNAEKVKDFVSLNNVSVIINCAAYTNVDKAEDDDITADKINHYAVKNLALACKDINAKLIHISTDYVFNGTHNLPYREEEKTDPLGVYGRTKLMGENAILDSGASYFIFRTSWLYSSFGNNFVKAMLRLISEREELNVVFDQVGTPTYAGDLAKFIVGLVEKKLYLSNQGIYHFSNEGVCSWYDFAMEIKNLSGNIKCHINPCHSNEFPSKVRRPNFSVLDKTKVKETFGVEVPYWKDSLKKCIEKLT